MRIQPLKEIEGSVDIAIVKQVKREPDKRKWQRRRRNWEENHGEIMV